MRLAHISIMALLAIASLAGGVQADGTIDFVIDPAAPTVITKTGSYRLTGDATMNSGVGAISLLAGVSNVTIDLGGHTISSTGGVANAISAPIDAVRVKVLNGYITGFGGAAVAGRAEWSVADLTVSKCGIGILLGARSRAERCTIVESNFANPAQGGAINAGTGAVIRDCSVTGTNAVGASSTGIKVGDASRVEGCVVQDNSAESTCSGINAGQDCAVINCQSVNNRSTVGPAYGIEVSGGSTVSGCVASGQSAGGGSNGEGILASSSCTLRGNICRGNISSASGNGFGILAGDSCSITENECLGNQEGPDVIGISYGIYAGIGCNIARNTCNGNNANGPGIAYGIRAASNSKLEGNYCQGNTAEGDGAGGAEIGAGLFVSSLCTVIGNTCSAQITTGAGALAYGIYATSTGNAVVDNTCSGNTTAGLRFTTASNNRVERNRLRQGTAIDTTNGVNPASLGAGDLANILY